LDLINYKPKMHGNKLPIIRTEEEIIEMMKKKEKE
jgi:hypothetical protein